jgi:hypothetical protein
MSGPRRAAATAVLVVALAGCGSSGGTQDAGGATSPPPRITLIHVGAGDDGRTVHVSVGQTIKLRLKSTYWQVAKGQPDAVLRTVGRQTRPTRSHSCVPGQGCGVVTAAFVARHPGKGVIAASRTSCGEAMRCSAAQGTYRVRVVVQP